MAYIYVYNITSHHITGVYSATLCDHRLTALNGIAPVALCVDNHDMSAHIEALRAIKTISTRTKPRWQVTLFLSLCLYVCVCLSLFVCLSACRTPIAVVLRICTNGMQPCYDHSTKEWACCAVCQSDPTWPYITKVSTLLCMYVCMHACTLCF